VTTDARPLPALALSRRDRDFVDGVWDFFVALRLTIPVMICLAVSCILGTFINPENTSLSEITAHIGNRWWFPIYMFFEANDLFRSWWFMLLLVVLTLNLTACTIERLPRIFKIALRPDKLLSDKLLRGIRHQTRLALPEGDAQLGVARVAGLFRARGYQPEIFPGEGVPGGEAGAMYLFAERGRYSRFGVWTVHLSLFMILGGALVGRFTGEEGVINVPMDGGTFDYFFRKTPGGMAYKEPLGFTVRVDDFRLKKYVNGNPRSFESDLAVLGPKSGVSDKPTDVLKKTILVGEPLEYRGWTIYQASYQAVPERDQAKLHVLDKLTHKDFDLKLTRDRDLQLGSVTLRAVNYTPNLSALGPAVKIERQEAGQKTSFWVLQKYPDFDTDNRGDRFGLRFDGLESFYFTGLQVARDPGYLWWLSGCCVLFLGLGIAFYTSHRRLWAKVSADGKLTLAGVAHKNQAAFEEVYQELSGALGAGPV